jgi:hypothetical protein
MRPAKGGPTVRPPHQSFRPGSRPGQGTSLGTSVRTSLRTSVRTSLGSPQPKFMNIYE